VRFPWLYSINCHFSMFVLFSCFLPQCTVRLCPFVQRQSFAGYVFLGVLIVSYVLCDVYIYIKGHCSLSVWLLLCSCHCSLPSTDQPESLATQQMWQIWLCSLAETAARETLLSPDRADPSGNEPTQMFPFAAHLPISACVIWLVPCAMC